MNCCHRSVKWWKFRKPDLEIAREFFVKTLEKIFSKGFMVCLPDHLPLLGASVSQDRYDQVFVGTPSCEYKTTNRIQKCRSKKVSHFRIQIQDQPKQSISKYNLNQDLSIGITNISSHIITTFQIRDVTMIRHGSVNVRIKKSIFSVKMIRSL